MNHKLWVIGVSLAFAACTRAPAGEGAADGGAVVGRYDGGVITEADLRSEAGRLPATLRQQFESPAGQREFVRSLIDKRLLVQEARRRGLHEDAEVRRQVRELEERLAVQALLAAEERAAARPTDEQLQAYYQAHLQEFTQPERIRVVRVLAALPAGSPPAERAQAKRRAEQFLQRLRKGEAPEKVGKDGDGPERTRGGELGWFARGDRRNPALDTAAFALAQPGAISGVVEESEGYSVLTLLERQASRVPPFDEVRSAVEGRQQPQLKRKVLDDLLSRLRKSGGVSVDVAGPQ
ncbi:peptidylprolyl isomerase [Myxococcaceae bacterium GXIMD 01537]